jgi:hypothetical protein
MRTALLAVVGLTGFTFSQATLADFESPAGGSYISAYPAQARPWDLSIRASLGHNDNVQLVPDATTFPTGPGARFDASYTALQLNGGYRFVNTATHTLGFAMSAEGLWYENTNQTPVWEMSDYNISTANPALYGTWRFLALGRPASLTASYDFRWEEGQNVHAIGLHGHTLKLDGGVFVQPNVRLSATYSLSDNDYGVTFPTPSLNSRDAIRNAIDLGMRVWFDNGLRNVSLGLFYVDNDAEGSNFAYDGGGLRGRFETQLVGPVWLALDMRYASNDYAGFTSAFIPAPGRRYQDILATGARLLWPINRAWAADVFYTREGYDSNQPEFESDVHVYGAGMTYRF